MPPFIVGNWKMNGLRAMLAEARAIDRAAARQPGVDVAIAPPFTLINAMSEAVSSIAVGGQDCHTQSSGAHTGDISAAMLADVGAQFVIVGHSERRADHGESNALVKAKAEAAIAAGLGVIVCVGETLTQRDAGNAEAVVVGQISGSLPAGGAIQELGSDKVASRIAVAYEPVWAIGTGRVAAASDVELMHARIRKELVELLGEVGNEVRILYGGSVNAGNAAELLSTPGVGGALVGGASLTAEAFSAIILAAAVPDEA